MSEKDKKKIFIAFLMLAIVILLTAGATFAYFQTTTNSDPNAVNMQAAIFKLDLKDDTSLIKTKLIPSIEEYVDIASTRRDDEGNLLAPYIDESTGETIIAKTACIDDNLKEICSIYTFSITNDSEMTIPLYFTLDQGINTFENLYFKIIDDKNNVVMPATRMLDDRYEIDETTGKYKKDEDGKLIEKANFNSLKPSPIVLTGINKDLEGTTDKSNPSKVTYSIVMWIMETHVDQTEEDSGRIFASTLYVTTTTEGSTGITGTFSAFGRE